MWKAVEWDMETGEGYSYQANEFDGCDPGYEDDSNIGCGDCPDDECNGHCMSCSYRSV